MWSYCWQTQLGELLWAHNSWRISPSKPKEKKWRIVPAVAWWVSRKQPWNWVFPTTQSVPGFFSANCPTTSSADGYCSIQMILSSTSVRAGLTPMMRRSSCPQWINIATNWRNCLITCPFSRPLWKRFFEKPRSSVKGQISWPCRLSLRRAENTH